MSTNNQDQFLTFIFQDTLNPESTTSSSKKKKKKSLPETSGTTDALSLLAVQEWEQIQKDAIKKLVKSGVPINKFSGDLSIEKAEMEFNQIEKEYRKLLREKQDVTQDLVDVQEFANWNTLSSQFADIKQKEEDERRRRRDIEDGVIEADDSTQKRGRGASSSKNQQQNSTSTATTHDFTVLSAIASACKNASRTKVKTTKKLLTLKPRPTIPGEEDENSKHASSKVKKEQVEELMEEDENYSDGSDSQTEEDNNGNHSGFMKFSEHMENRPSTPDSVASADLDSSLE